jgi:hypothetical protein
VLYWLPFNTESASAAFWYFFRWFTISGPFYVLYKIPEWGISLYSIFGVLSGFISTAMIIISIRKFKDKYTMRNIIAISLYFPYTILLNTLIALSIIRHLAVKERFFIR